MRISAVHAEKPAFNPYGAIVAGVVAVSFGAIFARLADAPSIVIAAYRVGVATMIILPIAVWQCRSEFSRLSKKDIGFGMLSGFFLAIHFITWISSLDYTSVANSVVLVNTNPLWVALLTPLMTRDRMKRRTLFSILLSVAGAIIIGAGDFNTGTHALFGDALALAGSLSAAAYLLMGRNLRQQVSLLTYVSICYGSASLILWGLVFILKLPVSGFNPHTWGALMGIALIPQLIGHTCYNWALKWFSAGLIAVSLLGEPIGSTILAYLLFHEGLTLWKITGGCLILTAIYMAAMSESK